MPHKRIAHEEASKAGGSLHLSNSSERTGSTLEKPRSHLCNFIMKCITSILLIITLSNDPYCFHVSDLNLF